MAGVSKLEPGEHRVFSFEAEEYGDGIYSVNIINNTSKKQKAENCQIKNVIVLEEDATDVKNATDVYLANGIGIGSTKEEVLSLMGEPSEENTKASKSLFYIYNVENDADKKIIFKIDESTGEVKMMAIYYR